MSVSNLRSPERFYIAGSEHADAYRGQCMKCGVCTIRCPTFGLLRDEKDGPRGRVAMAVELLEGSASPKPETVTHLDRCLSCLACSNTCPFGVDHTHLWDEAKARIETTYRRPVMERLVRGVLATVLPRPSLFRLSLKGAALGRLIRPLLPAPLRTLVDMAPRNLPRANGLHTGTFAPEGAPVMRVALLAGCAQEVLRASIHEATTRLLARHGVEVVVPPAAGCCGALVLHMGRQDAARAAAKTNIEAWEALIENGGLDAIVINASGCGTTVKNYGDLFKGDPEWHARAERISALARDVSEVVALLALKAARDVSDVAVVYHNPCSMENGQGIRVGPVQLLRSAGFKVVPTPNSPACCGSAGTYNMLQPEIASELGRRKASALESAGADVIATGNIGCQVQVGTYADTPVLHTVELLDWATGGPKPDDLTAGAA